MKKCNVRLWLLVTASLLANLTLAQDKIYWTEFKDSGGLGDGAKILRADINSSKIDTVLDMVKMSFIRNDAYPQALTVDATMGKIYWADHFQVLIAQADLDGSNPQVVIDLRTDGFYGPIDIAIDNTNRTIYWVSRSGRVLRSRLDGPLPVNISEIDTVLDSKTTEAVAIDLDIKKGKIYWAFAMISGGRGIARANLDGTDIDTVYAPHRHFISNIALNQNRREVYGVTSTYGGILFRVPMDSLNRTIDTLLVVRDLRFRMEAIVADTLNDKIYWLKYGPGTVETSQIRRMNVDGSNDTLILDLGFRSFPTDFALLSNNRTSIKLDHRQEVSGFLLFPAYPNPFNASTTIRYTLPKRSHVIRKVFNLTGQEIETLVDEEQIAGEHQVHWNAISQSSGVYFYRFNSDKFVSVKKLVYIK